jgi:hypothetical protein
MNRFIATSVAIVLVAGAAIAQNPCGRAVQPTDQERIVQRDIQERIDESIEAAEADDLPARAHYFAPDLTLKVVDGTILDRKQVEAGMKRDSDWILSVSDKTSITIDCLELKGTLAILLTNQHFVRTVPDRKNGSPHELITNATHRETWVYTRSGWLTEKIEELRQGPTYLDGKLYEN